MDMTFQEYFERACRRHGIYAPHRMDAEKLREKWSVFRTKCPEEYGYASANYLGQDTSWESVMRHYYRA